MRPSAATWCLVAGTLRMVSPHFPCSHPCKEHVRHRAGRRGWAYGCPLLPLPPTPSPSCHPPCHVPTPSSLGLARALMARGVQLQEIGGPLPGAPSTQAQGCSGDCPIGLMSLPPSPGREGPCPASRLRSPAGCLGPALMLLLPPSSVTRPCIHPCVCLLPVWSFSGLPHPATASVCLLAPPGFSLSLLPSQSPHPPLSTFCLSVCVSLSPPPSLCLPPYPHPFSLSPLLPAFLPVSSSSCHILQLPPLSLEDTALCQLISDQHTVAASGHWGHKLPAKLNSEAWELPLARDIWGPGKAPESKFSKIKGM